MARTEFKITGFDKVKSNLNKEIQGIKGRSMRGLIESSIIIRRSMETTPPKIPIDLGNLRASWFTTRIRTIKGIGLIMGFSANYAIYVHENVDADFTSPRTRYSKGKKRTYTPRAGAGPKFLQAALFNNVPLILQTIQKNAKV
jgi:hypothetical protein